MTPLERLALAVSARDAQRLAAWPEAMTRLSGDDMKAVLDYAAALERSARVDALNEALAVVIHTSGHRRTGAEGALREMIERERV
jgi:hypothetical protein